MAKQRTTDVVHADVNPVLSGDPTYAEALAGARAMGLQPGGEDGTAILFSGCVIRPDASGVWDIIQDVGHEPQNVSSVTQTSSRITVNLTNPTNGVISAFATPDETLSGFFECGPSISNSQIHIDLKRVCSIGGYYYYSGGWQVAGEVGIIGKAWSSNALRLTIPLWAQGNHQMFQATSRGGVHVAQAGSAAADNVNVEFFDWTGTQVTTQDSDMKVRVEVPPGGQTIDPAGITSNNFGGGNIWVGHWGYLA